MSAAVAHVQHPSPRIGSAASISSNPSSGPVVNQSPNIVASSMDGKQHSTKNSPLQNSSVLPKQDAAQGDSKIQLDNRLKPDHSEPAAQPLAPPPRPAGQNGDSANTTTAPAVASTAGPGPGPAPAVAAASDYFAPPHNNGHLSLEPNPFEREFGNPSAPTSNPTNNDTPGKSLGLPGVATLTSPAPLIPGSNGSFNWANSLRSGPLSPAMLAGPTGGNDYFDSFRTFPTPNESSLRTGLTPGGGGSIFPAPSPNTSTLFQSHLGTDGISTPGTLEFRRTANALNSRKDIFNQTSTSVPSHLEPSVDQKPPTTTQPEIFGHDTHDAALTLSGLSAYSTSQSRAASIPATTQFSGMPSQSAVPPLNVNPSPTQNTDGALANHQVGRQSQDSSPNLAKRATRNASLTGSISGMSAQGMSEISNDLSSNEEQSKPTLRGKSRKMTAATTNTMTNTKSPATNNRRKADDAPSKVPASKKTKSSGSSNIDPKIEGSDSLGEDDHAQRSADTKKMTDEEKRKNFLERNRVAALKCRQRKKQWLQNLQNKVELFSNENDMLNAQVTQLREEVVNLKTLLLAHKDCPISQAQGISALTLGTIPGAEFAHHPPHPPYGIPMQNGGAVIGGHLQRR